MSQKSAPLHLELRPSRVFAVVLLVMHGGAVVGVLSSPLPWLMRIPLAALVLFSLRYTISRWALLTDRRAITMLIWDEPGEWTVLFANGKELRAQLLPDSFVSSRWVVLNLVSATPRKRLSVIIFPDSLDRESFRRLRVRLRLKGVMESE